MTEKIVSQDSVGMVFHSLTVLREFTQNWKRYWVCLCGCGNEITVWYWCVKCGNTKSCGCLQHSGHTTHGLTSRNRRPPGYNVWLSMRDRCNNPNNSAYHNYGGRGITVCKRWDDFALFLADVGPRPSAKHSLDRRDNNGNYEPNNVCWATATEQHQNKRTNHNLIFDGKTMCLTAWAREIGLSPKTLEGRIRGGWPIDKALTLPKDVHSKPKLKF